MDIMATREVILSIKKAKDEQHLSISDILKKVNEHGQIISETTLRRIFADGSEDSDSFNYETTIRPVAQVLVNSSPTSAASAELYLHICQYKMEVIESMKMQIDHLKEEHENRCREYDKRMAFLRDQIELKDRRMDEQAQRIDRLLERIDKLMDVLIEKM